MKTIVASLLVFALGCVLGDVSDAADNFPSRPLRLVVPNAPGGGTDFMARLYVQYLPSLLGQQVVLEYKPGANSALGTEYVAKSAPNGYTIGMVLTSHLINPSIRKLGFDTLKDLSGITLTGVSPLAICANPQLPANTISELIALAKKQPGKLTYATPGSGSSMHMAGELLKQMAGIDILHVPFKGIGPAYPEVYAGRIDLLVEGLFGTIGPAKTGRIKQIAITSPQRVAGSPNIPTVSETLPGFSVLSIMGVVAPSATPREIVNRLNRDFVAMLRLPEVKSRLAELGTEPVGNTPEEFDAFIRAEVQKWAKVVSAAQIKAED